MAFLSGSFYFLLLLAAIAGLVYAAYTIRNLRRERDELRQEKEVIFGFVHDIGEVFAYSDELDLDRMLGRVLFYAMRTTRAGAGGIYLLEEDNQYLRARVTSGIFPPLVGELDGSLDRAVSKSQHIERIVKSRLIRKGEGLIGEAADFGQPILIGDAQRDPRVPRYREDFLNVRSVLIVPMRFLQRVIGVIAVVNRVDGLPFIQADLSLMQALADQASVSVHHAGLRDTLDEKQRIDHDLAIARQIQRTLLPKAIPRVECIELAAFNVPAQEIGGDYYDFIQVDDDHLGIAIADVSGKGIVGAIMMAVSRSALRAQAPGNHSPASVLKAVNRVMSEDIAEDMFVSMLYMILNKRTHELVVARAGHERPALSQGGGKGFTIIDSPGMALGIADVDFFDAALREERVPLSPGDVVVAYTDGVTEAMNEGGEEWGIDNFLEAVNVAAPEGANSVLNNVQQRVLRFAGDMGQYDDMTLLALRVLQ